MQLKSYLPVGALLGCFAIALFILTIFERNFVIGTGTVPALDRDAQVALYQAAVSILAEQSISFSGWALALIAASWYVLINTEVRSRYSIYMFSIISLTSIVSMYFGQLLHQSVIIDVRDGQDPLADPSIWAHVHRQYWSLVTGASLLFGYIAWRYVRTDAN